jgi:acetyl esterase/lipase
MHPSAAFQRLATQGFLTMLARRYPAAVDVRILLGSRDLFEILGVLFPVAPDVRVTPFAVPRPGPDGGTIRCERLVPPGGRADRVLLYCHGGCFVMGSVATSRNLAAEVARAARATAVTVDYRLAPEHPFSAGPRDMISVYAHLLGEGLAPARVAFAGDSAGGGLALALVGAVREVGLPAPGAVLSMSGWTDLALTGASVTANAWADRILSAELLRGAAAQYLHGVDAAAPLASPLHADFAGAPPLLAQVGSDEILLDDSTRVVERARAAGARATATVWSGMQHDFQLHCRSTWSPVQRQAREAVAEAGAFLTASLGP